MKKLSKALFIFIAFFSFSVIASPLTQPKADGIVGERFDGYIGLVQSDAPTNIKALVESVNNKRKAKYKEIAKKRQQPLNKVEMIAGESAIKKTLKGNYIFLKGKGWVKK